LPKDYRDLPFGKSLPLTLPAKLASDEILKRLVFGDAKKELTPTEEIQLTNIRKKIQAEHRLDKRWTLKTLSKEQSDNKKRSDEEKKKAKKRKRQRPITAKMLRKLQRRQQLTQTILKEAAALGWDMLGNEADRKK